MGSRTMADKISACPGRESSSCSIGRKRAGNSGFLSSQRDSRWSSRFTIRVRLSARFSTSRGDFGSTMPIAGAWKVHGLTSSGEWTTAIAGKSDHYLQASQTRRGIHTNIN